MLGLKKKLSEIDGLMTPLKQQVIHEVHPEVSFCEMNAGRPLTENKETPDGERQRIGALKRSGFPEAFLAPLTALRSGRDDFLDACAALWTADRIYRGIARRLPDKTERDERGLDIAIWF
jgi:predicted RNase H-like nuclease